jgi:glyoxylase-like metal-dependent hydrolase (beta-lactamase superfamily II)
MMSQGSKWFHVRELGPGAFAICEPGHVNSFLLTGRERALLVDTGLGVGSIRSLVETLTELPVSVVNTHSHPDHVAGNHEFEEIAIHPHGREALERQPFGQEAFTAYMNHARALLAAAERYEELDRAFFQLFDAEARPRPFPAGFDPDAWTVRPSRATSLVREGERIDLGGRSISVIDTPGHSPDGICLLDERDGLLVAGDTLGTGPLYAQFPDSDVRAFASSVERLRELAPEVRLVLISHFNRATVDPGLIEETARGFERLLEGDVRFGTATDLTGATVREARFDRFSILVPPVR